MSLVTSLRSDENLTIKTKSLFETVKNTPNDAETSFKDKKLSPNRANDQMTNSNIGGVSASMNDISQ